MHKKHHEKFKILDILAVTTQAREGIDTTNGEGLYWSRPGSNNSSPRGHWHLKTETCIKQLQSNNSSPRGHWHGQWVQKLNFAWVTTQAREGIDTNNFSVVFFIDYSVEMRYKPENKVLVFVTRKMIKEWCERQVPRKVLGDSHLKNLDNWLKKIGRYANIHL